MLSLLWCLFSVSAAFSADPASATRPVGDEHEAIRFFERYKPSFFLVGKPITKVQISFKVQLARDIPFYFGYTQLMIWDLFRESAPIRDWNLNPQLFYRVRLGGGAEDARDLDLGAFEHESNGRSGPESRSWNHVFLRYTSTRLLPARGLWWSLQLSLPYAMDDSASRTLPARRGLWEAQLGLNHILPEIFEVNELILRVYGGGASRINPVYGGQELTYREKESRRKLLLPLYLQIFHGYGENLLDADEERWGLRAGVGF